MAKVSFNITEEEFEKAAASDFVQPKPGLYTAQLKECNPTFAKGDDGTPDKKRPMLECIYQITGLGKDESSIEENYAQLWDYVTFSEAAAWKRAQFLLAMGISDGKKNFKGKVDTEEVIGTKVVIRVKSDKDQDGNYRGKIAAMFPFTDEDEDAAFGGDEEGGDDGDDDESPF